MIQEVGRDAPFRAKRPSPGVLSRAKVLARIFSI